MYYYVLFVAFLMHGFSQDRNSSFLSSVKLGLKPQPTDPPGKDRSIGFLLSHPDDESMFFVPTLNVLRRLVDENSNSGPKFYFLYLSNGDSDGMGSVRESELKRLCSQYGYYCKVVDDPDLRDSKYKWNPRTALKHVKDFVNDNNVTVLFTFDGKGVSGHPNHVGTHDAVRLASKHLKHVKFFYLETVDLFSKYSSFLSVFMLFFKKSCVVSFSPLNVYRNMKVHQSQLRSHIPFWSFFSSYSYFNSYLTL